ncbi:MAG: beta-lactamase family protein [Cytophagaceae bacterium]|nr:beta-lactamase family protein [Cytophagaceae bacterium]
MKTLPYFFKSTLSLFLFSFCYYLSFSQNLSEINNILEEKKNNFNGHLIMVIKQQDSTLYTFQTGLAKLETRVNIASASKWISASVILSLVDQGYLKLDDSIGKYLPVFSKYGKGKPTIRQCLTHTSGFPSYSNLDYNDISLHQLVDSMAKYVPLKNKPGEVFQYGGMSYRIAGRIAEVVTGKSWSELFQFNIASKCEMTNTLYCMEKNNPDLGGGVCATTSDYLNFLNMIANNGKFKGVQVLSESSVKEFFISQINKNVRSEMMKSYPQAKELSNHNEISYGLGTWIYNYKESQLYQTEIFCPGYFGTFPFVDNCRNIYGIILTKAQMDKVINTELKVLSIVKNKYQEKCK